ncbi:Protein ANTI-SILENCING 1, partial [Mucuna pruriens]
MSHPTEANVIDFKWGNKRGVGLKNKDIQYYDSFVYEGVEYFLYDCVYLFTTGHVETSIAKLVKIYERPTRQKMVKVVWFFRPMEIRNFLGHYHPSWNELFLASAQGKGVSNANFLESIIGKCNVVCTSKDKRNPKPSETELKKADFFFNCTFDVVKHVINDKFPNEIDGVKVERFFNRKGDEMTSNHLHVGTNIRPKIVIKTRTVPCTISHCQVNDKAEVRNSENVLPKQSSDSFPYKKRKSTEQKPTVGQISKTPKEEEIDEKNVELRQDERVKTYKKVIDVTERPDAPWDERLRRAQELETLVLLNNLDPSYTSYEVEDLVWCALKARVEARMIEWSPTSNTYYGGAFVIFKTKDAAESAISELNKRCLILGEGRIVSATKETLCEASLKRKFTGHLVIDRAAIQKLRQEMRNAVSTSHCSQPNTIEYEMAVEWLLRYEKSNACWNGLCQRQMKEIQDVKSKLKMERILSDEANNTL